MECLALYITFLCVFYLGVTAEYLHVSLDKELMPSYGMLIVNNNFVVLVDIFVKFKFGLQTCLPFFRVNISLSFMFCSFLM